MELLSKHATLHLAIAVATLAHITGRQTKTARLHDSLNINSDCHLEHYCILYTAFTERCRCHKCPVKAVQCIAMSFLTHHIGTSCYCDWNIYNSDNFITECIVVWDQNCTHPDLQIDFGAFPTEVFFSFWSMFSFNLMPHYFRFCMCDINTR